MATIKGIKVGTTTITASYTDGGVTQSASVANFQVTAIAPTLTFTAASGTLTYTGSAQTIGTVTYNGDGTAYYCVVTTTSTTQPSAPTSGWVTMTGSSVSISATNAGYHHVFLKSDAGTNYTAVSTKYTTYKQIGKATVNVTTAPAYVTSTLTYNGNNQTLVQNNAACSPAAGGTFYYYVSTSSTAPTSFSTSTWSTTRPTGKNAGNYYVWYYCYVSDTNNYTAGTNANAIKALANSPKNIGQKEVTLSWGTTSWAYDKATHSTTCTAGSLVSGDTCTVTLTGNSVGPNVGSATVTASSLSNNNYKLPSSNTTTISITAKTATLSWGTTSWVYNGSAHSTTCTVSNLESGDTCTVTLSGNTITNVGSTTVTATELSNSNYALPSATADKSTTLTVTIRTVEINEPTYNSATLTYDKTEKQITAQDGSCTPGGTMYYYISTSSTKPTFSTASGSGWSSSYPKATNAGTYYVWYYCQVTDTTNNTGTGINTVTQISGTKVINQKTATLAWGTTSWVYDNSTHSTTCSVSNLVSGDSCTVTLSGNSVGPDIGSATVTATALSNSNYKLPTATVDKSTTISITKADATLPSTISGDSVSAGNVPYHNTARATVTKDYEGGTLQYSTDNGSTWNNVTWYSGNLTANPSRTALGSTTVKFRVSGDSNHNTVTSNDSVTLTVYAATDARLTVDLTSRTYNTNNQVIASVDTSDDEKYHGVSSYSLGLGSSSSSAPSSAGSTDASLTAKNAGTYYVWYKYTKDANHGGTTTDWAYVGSVQIAKANRSGAVSCADTTFPTHVTATVSGNTESGAVTWGITPGTGNATINSSGEVTPTQAGTVTVTASVAATANYNAYTATPATITISKGTGVVTYSTSNPAAKYCITTANAADAAATDIEFTIATASASSSTNTGVTITYSISESGWSISSDGKKVTVPEDTPAGTYDITVTATAPATTNYNQAQKANSVRIVLTAVVLTGVTLTIPVNQIAYNAETTATLVATYNNGETKDVSADSNTTYSSSPTGIVTITK